MDIRNFGQKSIDEVKDSLAGLGLNLRTAPPVSDRRRRSRSTPRTTNSTQRTSSSDELPLNQGEPRCPRRRKDPASVAVRRTSA